jgi:ubiquinone/menaquinone biosynthesis C-methylase UbiE
MQYDFRQFHAVAHDAMLEKKDDPMTDLAAFWNNAAPKYAKSPIGDPAAYEYTLERTRSYLKPSDKVLELGCGTGSTALLLAPHVKQITGMDLSPGMLAIAQEKTNKTDVKNLEFVESGTVPDTGQYDVVMGHSLFHLVPDMEARFAQINALLPTDGYFISKTVCLADAGTGITGRLKSLMIRVMIPLMQLVGKAPYVRRFTAKELEAAVTAAGFEIVESGNHPKGPPPAHYIVARKCKG